MGAIAFRVVSGPHLIRGKSPWNGQKVISMRINGRWTTGLRSSVKIKKKNIEINLNFQTKHFHSTLSNIDSYGD